MRMMGSQLGWRVAVLGLVLLVGAPAGALGATAAEKCAGAKAKALGAAVLAEAQCQAKARTKSAAVDAACLQKAEKTLQKRFSKAGPCPGDVTAARATASSCVAAIDGATAGAAACAARKIKAAGKQAAARSACAKKAAVKRIAIEPCLAKGEGKLTKAVAKADQKGACTGRAEELSAAVEACLGALPFPIACDGGAGFATCDGSCPDGLTCRPYEVFTNGASVETGCSCVDVAQGPECSGTTCGADRHCPDPTHVCERWLGGDPLGCDHMICQPALTTPTTLPPREMLECDGGEFPTCGGACPDGERCQAAQALLMEYTFFAGCVCVDPRGPRCEMPTDCDLDVLPFTHCADPSKVCLVTLVGEGDEPSCSEAHCGEPQPIMVPPTSPTSTTSTSVPTTSSTTSTSTSSTTSTSTSTTTSTTVPCTSAPAVSGCFTDLGDCTILDTCTGLQWEQKLTTGGLHHVDNRYPWAGKCGGNPMFLCQPNAAAAATCMAHAEGGTYGCDECASGTCEVEVDDVPTITVWEWIDRLNDYRLAGHDDWRLPREAGLSPTGDRELESILLAPHPCGTSPCIDPIFGPTPSAAYWSATTTPANPDDAWFVYFGDGGWGNDGKRNPQRVRAVREPGP